MKKYGKPVIFNTTACSKLLAEQSEKVDCCGNKISLFL